MPVPGYDLGALLDDICRGNCVPFLGSAGDIAALAEPALAGRLCAEIGYSGEPLRLMDAAQRYEVKRGRNALAATMRDWLADPSLQPGGVHRFLAQLPLRFYLTTAQHDLLEVALRDAGHHVLPIVYQVDAAYMDLSRTVVVKLMGDAHYPESLRLTEPDYVAFMDTSPLLADIVRATIATRTLLFVSYDLGDAPLRNLFFQVAHLQGVHKRSAYAVWPSLDEDQAQFWARQNLRLIVSEPLPFLNTLHRELSRLRPPEPPGVTPLPDLPERPFRFLDAYSAQDAALFAGREVESASLTRKILAHRLAVLTGASGVGKSSLLGAGVGPLLASDGRRMVIVRLLGSPIAALRHAILLAAPSGSAGPLSASPTLRDLLATVELASGEQLVIALEQFEELFVSAGPDAQRAFMAELAACIEDPVIDAHFVISLRADFFLQLARFSPLLPTIHHNVFVLERLSREQAIAAIMRPLQGVGITVEEDLPQRIVADLDAGGIDPPQLQIICDRLYEDMLARGGRTIRLEDYARLGGADQLLAGYLGEVLRRDPEAGPVLEALVGDQDLKAARTVAEIGQRAVAVAALPPVLDRLIAARLVRSLPPASEDTAVRYELAHDVLAVAVSKWLGESAREAERARGVVERGLSDWRASGSLLDGPRLDFTAARWAFLPVVDKDAQAFLLRSSLSRGHDVSRWLERIPAPATQRAVLMDLAAGSEPSVSVRAIDELARAPGAAKDSEFLSFLRSTVITHSGPSVRHAAATALYALLPGDALSFLAAQATAADPSVRGSARDALAGLCDSGASLRALPNVRLRLSLTGRIAVVRLRRHRRRVAGRALGAAVGGAVGLALGFAFISAATGVMFIVAAFMLVFGAVAGLITGLGIAVAAALANGDRRLPRAVGGLIGGALGCALGLQGAQAAVATGGLASFALLGALAGSITGAGIGLLGCPPPRLKAAARVPVGLLVGIASAFAGFLLGQSVAGVGWTWTQAVAVGALFGAGLGTGLAYADSQLTERANDPIAR